MTKTTNYQLNQWAKSDRIMMDDFNADNAKIDAALKANADAIAAETTARVAGDALVKLMTATLEESTHTWQVDVSSIDLTQYAKLLIYPYLETNNSQFAYLRVNGKNTGYAQNNGATSFDSLMYVNTGKNDISHFGAREIVAIPRLPAVFFFSASAEIGASKNFVISRTPDLDAGTTHLNTLDFCLLSENNNPLLAGSKVHIYGLKL